uniref:Putative secreted protein n=1 Tax=Anopheles triannulatus TaxID=58253 RepID=A0A2M4B2N5_9DIPT
MRSIVFLLANLLGSCFRARHGPLGYLCSRRYAIKRCIMFIIGRAFRNQVLQVTFSCSACVSRSLSLGTG